MQLTPQYYLSEIATPQEVEVLVSQTDFQAALAELVPSVSEAEMAHYKTVQVRSRANDVLLTANSLSAATLQQRLRGSTP